MGELEDVIQAIIGEVTDFIKRLIEQSDRALVILAAARLDVGLERLLRRIMHHHPGGSDNLFDPERPLGTFSAKIALAYRLGAIDGALEHALQMVRKTRNDFAHFTERVNLTDPGQRCRVIEIARGAEQNRWWDQLYEMFLAMHEDAVDDTRTRFCTAFSVMLITLEAAEFVNEPVRIKQPANFAWG